MKPERGQSSSQSRRWLRVAAAADMLEVSEHTVRRWADSGVLPCRRSPSGQRQFTRGDLARFLAHAGSRPADDAGIAEAVGEAARRRDPRRALEGMARRLAAALDAGECLVCEYDRSIDSLVPCAGSSPPALGSAWALAEHPAVRELLEHGGTWRDKDRVWVPFGLGGAANGCFVLGRRRALAEGEVRAARDMGDPAALAVHRLQSAREQQEQAARVASLLDAGRSVTSTLVLQDVLDALALRVAEQFGVTYCVFWEYVPEEDALVERAGAGDAYTMDGGVMLLDGRPREREILSGAVPVIETLSDPRLDPESRASMERWGEKTCVSLPLRYGGESLGTLVLCECERERRFTEEELKLARGLADQASAAVYTTRMYRDLAQRNDELLARARRERLLNEVSLELVSSLELPVVLEAASRRICLLLEATGCEVWSRRDDESIECLSAWADGDVVSDRVGRRLPLDGCSAIRLALTSREPLAIGSPRDARLGELERGMMAEWGHRSLLVAPLWARGRQVGVLVLARSDAGHAFTEADVATAAACARMTALALDNATVHEHVAEHARRLQSLLVAGRAITSSLDAGDVLAGLARTAAQSLGFPEALIFQYDPQADTLTLRSSYQDTPSAYEDIEKPYPLSDYPSDRLVLESDDVVVETISDPALPWDVRASMELHDEKTCLTVPLRFQGTPLGMLVLVEKAEERVFSEHDIEFARGFAEQASVAIHNALLFENVKKLHLGNLRALSSALTVKDFYTIGHTARVTAYAVLLAHELGWSMRAIQQLEEATYLHDIGKIAVADRVLLKSGPLTDEEWALMRQHPVISAEIIEALLDEDYVAGVRHHHERYDGSGYPDGLAGERIPLIARLLCIVDSYDAMASRRVYRQALSYSECVDELRRCSGTQFDPALVPAFLRVLGRLAVQRDAAQRAAAEAAARIDAADHVALRTPEDAGRPEYARIQRALRVVRSRHPELRSLVTLAPVDHVRCMTVVDSEEDPALVAPLGEVSSLDDLEHETFAGHRHDATVVTVDRYGAWVTAAAPIVAGGGEIVGLVTAYRPLGEGLPDGLLEGEVSDTFSQIMRTAAARRTRTEVESVTDALTGLSNHRRFHEALHEKLECEPEDDVALLFCDVDNFKALNDRRGHLVGDEVLRRVSRVMTQSIRRGDIAARYGGDEFGILLADADAETAVEVAERIRRRVAELDLGREGVRTTISIGVATLEGGDRDADALLVRADRAMYAAKAGGRDRVAREGSAPASRAP